MACFTWYQQPAVYDQTKVDYYLNLYKLTNHILAWLIIFSCISSVSFLTGTIYWCKKMQLSTQTLNVPFVILHIAWLVIQAVIIRLNLISDENDWSRSTYYKLYCVTAIMTSGLDLTLCCIICFVVHDAYSFYQQ